MHIPDGWIDLPTSAAAAAVAAGATAVAARRAAVELRAKVTTLPVVLTAYVVVAQLLVLPVGFGTGAHIVGTGLVALLAGPAVAIVCAAAVVVLQALVLADGGVTAIGLNIVNDGVVPVLVAWSTFALLQRLAGRVPAAAVAGGLSSLAAGLAVAVEYAVGGQRVVGAGTVAVTIGATHAVVAVVEGALTAMVVATVLRLRPDLVRVRLVGAPA